MALATIIETATKPLPISGAKGFPGGIRGDAGATANAPGTESFRSRWQALVEAQDSKAPTKRGKLESSSLPQPEAAAVVQGTQAGDVPAALATPVPVQPEPALMAASVEGGGDPTHSMASSEALALIPAIGTVGERTSAGAMQQASEFAAGTATGIDSKSNLPIAQNRENSAQQPASAAGTQEGHASIGTLPRGGLWIGSAGRANSNPPDANDPEEGGHPVIPAIGAAEYRPSSAVIPSNAFAGGNGGPAQFEGDLSGASLLGKESHAAISAIGRTSFPTQSESLNPVASENSSINASSAQVSKHAAQVPSQADFATVEQAPAVPQVSLIPNLAPTFHGRPEGDNAPTSRQPAGAEMSQVVGPAPHTDAGSKAVSFDGSATVKEVGATAAASSTAVNAAAAVPASAPLEEPHEPRLSAVIGGAPMGASIPAATPGLDAEALPLPNAKSNSQRGVRSTSAAGPERAVHMASGLIRDDGLTIRLPVENAGLNPMFLHDPAGMTIGSGSSRPVGLPVAASGGEGFSSRDTFAALDAETNLPAVTWVQAGARHAEAGYQDPALGWVGVRAQSDGAGVHATLVPGSAEASQALNSHLSGLNTFVAEHNGHGSTVTMAAPESALGGREPDHGHDLQQGSGQQQTNQGRHEADSGEQNSGPLTPSDRGVTAVSMPVRAASIIDGFVARADTSGTHISVMA